MATEPKLSVLVRPASEADTPQVMDLTSLIWEGEDYIPSVWERWLADPQGRLAVAEYEGRILGLGKLTRLGPSDWWLEGLRTHPEFEGRGIAAQLHDSLLAYWEQTGNGALRLATASFRFPVHHLCERTGFEKAGEYTSFAAPVIAEDPAHFRLLTMGEAPEALEYVLTSPTLPIQRQLIDLGWEWAAPDLPYLEEAAKRKMAWWWEERRGLLLLHHYEDEEHGDSAMVELLACPLDRLAEILLEGRRLAARMGSGRMVWMAPLHPELQPRLEKAGFQRTWDAALFIYAKAHPSNP